MQRSYYYLKYDAEIRQKHGSEAKTTTSPIKTGNKHTGKCNNHSDFLLLQAYSDRGHTAQMLVYTRMGVSSLKNSVSATDNVRAPSLTLEGLQRNLESFL